VSVALFHFSVQLDVAARDAFFYGWIGVDVFFVISGFVIPLSLYGRGYTIQQFPQFMMRRLVRLEPPYLASIILVLAAWHLSAATAGSAASAPDYSWPQVASHLLYAIPLTPFSWISPVYWSLAYEFVFYIVTGLTFASLIRRPIEWTVLVAAAISALLYRAESGFDVCIVEFLIGIIVMRIVTGEGNLTRLLFWLCASIGVAFSAAGPWVGVAVGLAAVAILLLRGVQFGRWAIVAGSLSYSLYLTHTSIGVPIVNFAKSYTNGLPSEIALMIVALVTSIGFAYLFSRLIERPSMRAARHIAMQPQAADGSVMMLPLDAVRERRGGRTANAIRAS
jgi:peptidoglycan/LPS O-acetylase OafA/YrhL